MSQHEGEAFPFTARDRVMRAWQNSMELVRDFQLYAHELQESDPDAAERLAAYAETECHQAAGLRDLLRRYEN